MHRLEISTRQVPFAPKVDSSQEWGRMPGTQWLESVVMAARLGWYLWRGPARAATTVSVAGRSPLDCWALWRGGCGKHEPAGRGTGE